MIRDGFEPGAGRGEPDDPDERDHVVRQESSDIVRRGMLAEVLDRLVKAGWLNDELKKKGDDQLVDTALGQPPGLEGPSCLTLRYPGLTDPLYQIDGTRGTW